MKEYKLKINGNNYNIVINELDEATASVEVNGTPFTVEFEKPISKPVTIAKVVKPVTAAPVSSQTAASVSKPVATGSATVSSPLPGVILELKVSVGDIVKKGQCLLVLEAMKMENSIEASIDGTVQSIKVNKGDSVLEGAALVVIG
ncbi:MAG: biotin/lipoyl-binding protein [Bacteroidales bacterium]|nr:biotin/lipoyl-binding protein [Bacteroidales bacterium]